MFKTVLSICLVIKDMGSEIAFSDWIFITVDFPS